MRHKPEEKNRSYGMGWLILMTVMIAALPFSVEAAPDLDSPDLKALIRKVEQQYNGDSSHITAQLDILTQQWRRTVCVEGWSLGRDFCLTRVLKPKKERGITTLKAYREVWDYLPRVDRVIKIPPSMLGSPWMGSHISKTADSRSRPCPTLT